MLVRLAGCLLGALWGLGETVEWRCRWCMMADEARAALAAADGSEGTGHYTPSREIDILHLALDITPDFKRRSIAGTAVLRFKPIARALEELKLDA